MIGTNVIHKPWKPAGTPKELMFGKIVAIRGKEYVIQWDDLNGGCTVHTTKEIQGKIRNYVNWEKKNGNTYQWKTSNWHFTNGV